MARHEVQVSSGSAASLDRVQTEAFRRDGFLAPLDGFSAEEVRRLRANLEDFENSLPPGPVRPGDRRKLHARFAD
jgi:hypothetical protein